MYEKEKSKQTTPILTFLICELLLRQIFHIFKVFPVFAIDVYQRVFNGMIYREEVVSVLFLE